MMSHHACAFRLPSFCPSDIHRGMSMRCRRWLRGNAHARAACAIVTSSPDNMRALALMSPRLTRKFSPMSSRAASSRHCSFLLFQTKKCRARATCARLASACPVAMPSPLMMSTRRCRVRHSFCRIERLASIICLQIFLLRRRAQKFSACCSCAANSTTPRV